MNSRLTMRGTFLLSLLMLLAALPAHAAPVKGDNLASPLPIAVNSIKTVNNVHQATTEAGIDNLSSCDAGGTPTHSVWFSFELPWNATVDFITAGSILVSETTVTFPLIAVYSWSAVSGIAHMGCAQSGNLNALTLSAGEYRVMLGNMGFFEINAASRYKLRIRALQSGIGRNENFDAPFEGTWKIKKPDQVFRNCVSIDCRVVFNGAAKGQLSQKIIIPPSTQFKFVKGDFVTQKVYVNSTPPSGSFVRSTLVVTYSDGTPATSTVMTPLVTNTSTSGYAIVTQGVELQSAAVSGISVKVTSPNATDTFRIDYVLTSMFSGSARRDVLPLPPGP